MGLPPETTDNVETWFATLFSATAPSATIESVGVVIAPVCDTPPAAASVRLPVASALVSVLCPRAAFAMLTVLPLSTSVPKLLPALLRSMLPLLGTVEACAVKLATPDTESEVPGAWLMPVCTSDPPVATVGGLALTEMLPVMALPALFSTMALPLTGALEMERFALSLMTVRFPA